ncbi:MAG: hypothetical protein JOY85_18805, partial [Acidobacteriaceae bacterium]|nr:hypothetical protein [Acidobacteriaceae bacterium]
MVFCFCIGQNGPVPRQKAHLAQLGKMMFGTGHIASRWPISAIRSWLKAGIEMRLALPSGQIEKVTAASKPAEVLSDISQQIGKSEPDSQAAPQTASTVSPDQEAALKLIEALREFLKAQQLSASKSPERVTVRDAVWLLMSFGCVFLVLLLVPEAWLKSETTKFLLDKIAPWCLSLGAITAILKSPQGVIEWSRQSQLRWVVPIVLAALLFFTIPIVTLKPI